MKMHYVGVWRTEKESAVELCKEVLVNEGWLGRGTAPKIMFAIAKEVVPKIKPGVHEVIHNKKGEDEQSEDKQKPDHVLHALRRNDICVVIFTDQEYPERTAGQLLRQVCDEFLGKFTREQYINAVQGQLKYPELNDYIQRYQDPQREDILLKVQNELDQATVVMHKTIEALLGRGESLDTLVNKSEVLSAQSKMFYTQAKKQNSCCIVM